MASGTLVIVTFVDLFVFVFDIILIIRVLSSYFVNPHGSFYQGLLSLTEPLLAPIRKVIPSTPGVDFAPLAAFFLLWLVQKAADHLR